MRTQLRARFGSYGEGVSESNPNRMLALKVPRSVRTAIIDAFFDARSYADSSRCPEFSKALDAFRESGTARGLRGSSHWLDRRTVKAPDGSWIKHLLVLSHQRPTEPSTPREEPPKSKRTDIRQYALRRSRLAVCPGCGVSELLNSGPKPAHSVFSFRQAYRVESLNQRA